MKKSDEVKSAVAKKDQKKYDKMILILLLVAFGVGIFFTTKNMFNTYVNFAYAEASNRSVQVKGKAVEGTLETIDEKNFAFDMLDMEGRGARINARGVVPANLFEAEHVVVKGRFEGDIFKANQILVKCPSKYQPKE